MNIYTPKWKYNLTVRCIPLLAYFATYSVTCLFAAIPFYFGYEPLLVLVDYFSGIIIPTELSIHQNFALLSLLFVAPAIFAFGYFVAIRVNTSLFTPLLLLADSKDNIKVSKWVPFAAFCVAVGFGFSDLERVGAFSRFSVWTDYGEWVRARWMLFSSLGFFSFVNVYTLIPVLSAWMLLNICGAGILKNIARVSVLMIVVFFELALFQKKALIASLIIIFWSLIIYKIFTRESGKRIYWMIFGATIFLVAVYFVLVVVPVYSETSKTADELLGNSVLKSEINEMNAKRIKAIAPILGQERKVHLFAYAMLAPVSRAAGPAMYYPIVFPEHHAYFGIDVGQDILGWGGMPNDNRVVWDFIYPKVPGGSVMVPFHFVLYSQVGVAATLVLSAVLGFFIGYIWNVILACHGLVQVRSLVGSLLVLFCIYISMDSVRNSVVSSYGLIYGWLLICFVFLVGAIIKCRNKLSTQ